MHLNGGKLLKKMSLKGKSMQEMGNRPDLILSRV